jgi:N-terminal domain of oxidoreductase
MTGNRQVWLKSRPNGIPQAEDFDIRDSNIPSIAEGEFLVQNHYVLRVHAASAGVSEPLVAFWLALTSRTHPTMSEAFQESVLAGLGHPLHI